MIRALATLLSAFAFCAFNGDEPTPNRDHFDATYHGCTEDMLCWQPLYMGNGRGHINPMEVK